MCNPERDRPAPAPGPGRSLVAALHAWIPSHSTVTWSEKRAKVLPGPGGAEH